ncbi:GTP cyclohydrolase FolE2 [Bacillus swezeyi]|uniref:GTP cyclohydrolase FolE2 n=1 Tax=Bacillus swezeyi TaxID=1925020 RepID=A0A1R1QZK6_9BACI|nr:GTP cyclohydrolase FolE2 [Bacillus swezeyi]MEC1259765.1 GTP cyclohydrolase FolE2 [Bacillus swezeyi]MED2930123.1 GTP cyclohydrolase FolE2 [Bacillus swezeyi]MED2944814.1 GTP cyclohydrolase FolE2 [Bacillus swezeyi]MED2962988.1 GTP cyclohydrolase FolE2 [Bacillus swezeyi]MED2976307.1 GTP cyclohydrolase FolE2 [Bacillus swezeyi]
MKHELHLPAKPERHRRFGSVEAIKGTKPTDKENMSDLQNMPNDYFFNIDHVGVSNVSHPIQIESSAIPHTQTTIGSFSFTTNLDKSRKGINMSRLTEQLQRYHEKNWTVDLNTLKDFTKELADNMEQQSASVSVSFPWYFQRRSPETELPGLMHADIHMKVSYKENTGWAQTVGMTSHVTTLCPCSKEISEYSAHNQRGIISITAHIHDKAEMPDDFKTELLAAAETNASAKLHPVLKRPDEKRVTEQAYENPRFVEDIIRLTAADLYEMDWISAFDIECRNEESIHMHDAVARLSFSKS